MTQEKWKVITEYQGYKFDGSFEVSNWGNVRKVKDLKPIAFYQDNRGQGYFRFKLYDLNKKRVAIKVHRLVAYSFLGFPPGDKTEIDHIDGNAHNNSFTNLRWVTHTENCKYAAIARNDSGTTENH